MIQETFYKRDGAEFTQREIKQTMESLKWQKAPGMDGIKSDIFLRSFNKFRRVLKAIYNLSLQRGNFQDGGRQKIFQKQNSGKKIVWNHPNTIQEPCTIFGLNVVPKLLIRKIYQQM